MINNVVAKFFYHYNLLREETCFLSFMEYKNINYIALKEIGKEILPLIKEELSSEKK